LLPSLLRKYTSAISSIMSKINETQHQLPLTLVKSLMKHDYDNNKYGPISQYQFYISEPQRLMQPTVAPALHLINNKNQFCFPPTIN